jgi:hypothetical protein
MAALIVHHMNVKGERERGSTAFRGAADAMFGCRAEKDKENGRILRIELKNDKQKDGAEAPPIYLRPADNTKYSLVMEHTEGPEPKERGPKERTPMRVVDMLACLAIAEDGLTWNEWRIGSGIGKPVFNRRLKKLIADGEVFKENGRYFIWPTNVDVAGSE